MPRSENSSFVLQATSSGRAKRLQASNYFLECGSAPVFIAVSPNQNHDVYSMWKMSIENWKKKEEAFFIKKKAGEGEL